MCGVTGFVVLNKSVRYDPETVIRNMCKTIHHRGPDDSNVYANFSSGVFLGHTRLSILELSSLGAQPMQSKCGRYIIVYNGEIYNHINLREQINKNNIVDWKGSSDTETLLNAISLFGLKSALRKCIGMFSFALWDNLEKRLHLVRDRMGEKPMYYGIQKDTLLFGSELKSIKIHPEFLHEEDKSIISTFLKLGYIPSPWSIWKGIKKLNPGEIITFSFNKNLIKSIKTDSYWSFSQIIVKSRKNIFLGNEVEAIDELEKLLINSINGQLISDVPLGAFLSGGIDSSLVVSIIQSLSSRSLKTFSIGFQNKKYNEANYAKSVAKHLKTDHTELYVKEIDASDLIPSLTQMFDEPFGDSSSIPTFLVSKLAKKDVTVSLSGDGGDELFGGYSRYHNKKLNFIRDISELIPNFILNSSNKIINKIPYPSSVYGAKLFDKIKLFSELTNCLSYESFYDCFISQWRETPLKINSNKRLYGLKDDILNSINDRMHKMMAIDTSTYLPDDILTKVDRTAMAVSLETRVPLLDHRIVEYAWRLPNSIKLKNGKSKWILRQLLYKYVPKKLIERPKMGFGVPLGEWMRGHLRDWSEDLLDSKKLKEDGIFDEKIIENNWNRFIKGDNRLQHPLWLVLTYLSWKKNQKII